MEYLTELLKVLGIALVCAILATNTINGVKGAMAIDTAWINRVVAVLIDGLMSFWFYFSVAGQKDILTYVVCLVLTYAGAETIYSIMGNLSEAKKKYDETATVLQATDEEDTSEELRG